MDAGFWWDIFVFILTYLVLGIVLAAALRKCAFSPQTQMASTTILLFGLGVAPWLTASLLYFQFLLLPKTSPLGSLCIVLSIYALLAFWSRKHFRPLQRDLQARAQKILAEVRGLSIDWTIGLTLCAMIISYIVYQSMAFPIASHDGSVYAFLGKYLCNEGSLANYPMVLPDPRSGARMTLEHPPGLPLLYAWFHLFTPDRLSVLPRSVSAMFALYIALLLFDLLEIRRHLPAAITGTLILLLVPAFVWQSFDNSIDPPRLFLFLGSLVLLAYAFEERKEVLAACAGICVGFAAFLHVSGILIGFVGVGVIVINQRRSLRRLSRFVLIFAGTAALFGAGHYVNNMVSFGNPLGPSGQPLFTVSVANFHSSIELEHRNQAGEFGKLIFGRLQVFSRLELFGIAFWLFLPAIVFWGRRADKRLLDRVLLVGLTLFSIPVLYKYYSNRRYILTVLPCVAYLDGLMLADVYIRMKSKRALMWAGGVCGVCAIVASVFLPNSILSNKLGKGTNPLRFITASKSEQDRAIDGGLHEGIQFVNTNTPKDSVVLVSDERFFLQAQRKGVLWGHMNRLSKIYRMSWSHKPRELAQLIDAKKVGYVLIDHVGLEVIKGTTLEVLLTDDEYCVLLHDGEAKVWKWKGAARRGAQNDKPWQNDKP